jgi:transcriptional regulator of met regulon
VPAQRAELSGAQAGVREERDDDRVAQALLSASRGQGVPATVSLARARRDDDPAHRRRALLAVMLGQLLADLLPERSLAQERDEARRQERHSSIAEDAAISMRPAGIGSA